MSEERFVDLEMRLAHQDHMLHELNEALTDQQTKLMQLEDLCKSLVDRIRSLGEGAPAGDPSDERPPHY